MEILGIGAPELIFILLIALIVLGPRDMQRAGRTIGRWLNQLIRSDSWRVFQRTSAELRNLPRNLMRDANMEMAEMEKELRNTIDPRGDLTSLSESNRSSPAPQPNRSGARPAENSSRGKQPAQNTGAYEGDTDEPSELK